MSTSPFPLITDREFLAVRHSYLNGNSWNIDQVVEQTVKLERYTKGRRVIPCFEGDLVQLQDGTPVLTHQSFLPLSEQRYNALRTEGIAASVDEVLEKVARFRQDNSGQRVVLCFEPKLGTRRETIERVVHQLQQYGIQDAYFDSFIPKALDDVMIANARNGTAYPRSLHAGGSIGRKPITIRPNSGYEVLTVPYEMVGFGTPRQPIIYGAVGSPEKLVRAAATPDVVGAYVRFKEKSALRMFMASFTNTKKLRQVTMLALKE